MDWRDVTYKVGDKVRRTEAKVVSSRCGAVCVKCARSAPSMTKSAGHAAPTSRTFQNHPPTMLEMPMNVRSFDELSTVCERSA